MSEDPKRKDCLTCKWEPEWKKRNGLCARIPSFIQHRIYVDEEGISYSVTDEEYDDEIVKDCTLWEAKGVVCWSSSGKRPDVNRNS